MPALPLPSSAPTPEYRRHHTVEAPAIDTRRHHPGWKIETQLDRLLLDKLISVDQWHRAVALRADLERLQQSAMRVSSWEGIVRDRHCGKPGARGISEAQLEVAGRLKAIAAALGPVVFGLLATAIVEDLPWAQIGKRLGRDAKTAKSWVIAAVRALP